MYANSLKHIRQIPYFLSTECGLPHLWQRVYAKNDNIPRVLNGLGIAIISTSKGVMTDKEARKENVGGEVLAYIW